jgi:hypothetical protein
MGLESHKNKEEKKNLKKKKKRKAEGVENDRGHGE